VVKVLGGWHYGQTPKDGEGGMLGSIGKIICVWHYLTYMTAPFPGATGGNAISILKKYPQFDLIVTGDNHESFWTEYQGRILVNPGCMTRQKVNEADYKPSIYLWYAEDNSVERVHLPIQENVISREHIDIKEQRDQRIMAFVSRLNNDWQAEVSFEENLEIFKKKNKINDSVMDIIYKALET